MLLVGFNCATTLGPKEGVWILRLKCREKDMQKDQAEMGKGMDKQVAPICPICNKPAKRTITNYSNDRYDCCGLYAWGNHPLVDEATHIARRRAHVAFDPLWKEGHMSRTEAYYVLRTMMRLTEPECHMKVMNYETARRVSAVVKQIKKDLGLL